MHRPPDLCMIVTLFTLTQSTKEIELYCYCKNQQSDILNFSNYLAAGRNNFH